VKGLDFVVKRWSSRLQHDQIWPNKPFGRHILESARGKTNGRPIWSHFGRGSLVVIVQEMPEAERKEVRPLY